jgi:hypothetical protein
VPAKLPQQKTRTAIGPSLQRARVAVSMHSEGISRVVPLLFKKLRLPAAVSFQTGVAGTFPDEVN